MQFRVSAYGGSLRFRVLITSEEEGIREAKGLLNLGRIEFTVQRIQTMELKGFRV